MQYLALLLLLLLPACGADDGGGAPAAPDATAPAPDALVLEVIVDSGGVALRWPKDAWIHHRLVLTQGDTEIPVVVGGGGNEARLGEALDWVWLAPLVVGDVAWRLEADKSGFFRNRVVLGQGTLRAGHHFPGTWDSGAITVMGLPNVAGVGDTITVTGTVGSGGLRQDVVIATPSILTDSVQLATRGGFGPGSAFTMSYTFVEEGLYVVEFNSPGGGAVINWPVYVGGAAPIVPHPVETALKKGYSTPLPLASMRQELLDLVNAERASVGRTPLELDDALSEVAQAKSDDMDAHGYFGHTSPTWGGPSERAAAFGFPGGIGENLASDSSVLRAHLGLFWSPAHRENLLSASWTRMGAGFAKSGDNLLVTENFAP